MSIWKKREGMGKTISKGKIDGKKEEEDWEGSGKGTYGMFSTFPWEKLENWKKLFLLCGQGCTTYGDEQLKQKFKDNNMCFTAFTFEPKKFMNHKEGCFNDYK